MLDDLAAEGEKLRVRSAQPAPDLRELLGLSSESKVTISRDELGLIQGVAFETIDGKRAAPEELLTQLNLALYEGALSGMATMGTAAQGARLPGSASVDDSGQLSPQLRALMSSLESGEPIEPLRVTNDLKTVTVGAVNGDVVSIECTPTFLAAATDAVLEAEIVAVARRAAIESDLLGRYTKRSE